MYLDKKVSGVHAVQTLSRLNRIHPLKNETMVLDFVNTEDEIRQSFQPFYERTSLEGPTEPNLLYDLERSLEDFYLYTSDEVNRFAELYFNPKTNQHQLHTALDPIVDRYIDIDEDVQNDFRSQLRDFIRLYAFLSQVLTFTDADLEKLYVFARLLIRKLPVTRDELPIEIQRNIEIDFYRIQQTRSGKIDLDRGETSLPPQRQGSTPGNLLDEEEMLSQLIKTLNERFGTDFTEEDKVFLADFEKRLASHPAIQRSVQVNTPDNARLTYKHVAQDELQDMMDMNFKFYKRMTEDNEFAEELLGWLFERYLKAAA